MLRSLPMSSLGTSPAARALLEALPPEAQAQTELAGPGLEEALAALMAAARASWPNLTLDDEVLAAHLGRHLEPPYDLAALRSLRAADLYLCRACAGGDRSALEAFERAYFPEIAAAAARLGAGSGVAEDAAAQLRTLFFVGSETRPAVVATFAGRGDLRGWVRVAAMRAIARLLRKERREVRVVDESLLDVLSPTGDPELTYLKGLYRDQFAAAFRAALASTPARERTLLRYALLDGLTIDEIGDLYGVHRSTAARWLARARDGILARIRDDLKLRLNVDSHEVDSLLRMVHSRIGVSLERMLDTD